jgi:hypothetical protein
VTIEPVCADRRNAFGPPDAGNPHVRWDEGGGASSTLLLYSTDDNASLSLGRSEHQGRPAFLIVDGVDICSGFEQQSDGGFIVSAGRIDQCRTTSGIPVIDIRIMIKK